MISLALKISWVKGFVYETKGMLQCSEGNIEGALASFQESLRISDDQENLQRISNCFMALAAFALPQNEARRAVRLLGTVSEKQIRIRCWNPNIEEWTLDITEDKQELRDYADEPCSEHDDDDDDED